MYKMVISYIQHKIIAIMKLRIFEKNVGSNMIDHFNVEYILRTMVFCIYIFQLCKTLKFDIF